MAHPAEAESWEWDEGNESELARHNISAAEVEEVFEESPAWIRNRRHRSGDWKMLGLSFGGRRLTIVVRYDEVTLSLRPITGWDATAAERSRYCRQ